MIRVELNVGTTIAPVGIAVHAELRLHNRVVMKLLNLERNVPLVVGPRDVKVSLLKLILTWKGERIKIGLVVGLDVEELSVGHRGLELVFVQLMLLPKWNLDFVVRTNVINPRHDGPLKELIRRLRHVVDPPLLRDAVLICPAGKEDALMRIIDFLVDVELAMQLTVRDMLLARLEVRHSSGRALR